MKPVDRFNIIWTGLMLFSFALIIVSLGFLYNSGQADYNDRYVITYSVMAGIGILSCIIFGLFGVWKKISMSKENQLFFPGFISESTDEYPLGDGINGKFAISIKFMVIIIFTVIIAILSLNGFQIWGEPDVYSNIVEFASADQAYAYQEIGIGRSIFDVAFIPALTEDIASLLLASIIIVVINLLGYFLKIKNTKLVYLIGVIIACPIAAFGVGSLIPGFAQAHGLVAGSNIGYYFATWIFQTLNLYVMFLTGFFLPLPHFIHNAIYVVGFNVAFGVALFSIPYIICKIKRRSRWSNE